MNWSFSMDIWKKNHHIQVICVWGNFILFPFDTSLISVLEQICIY